jgi:hypothetical protein
MTIAKRAKARGKGLRMAARVAGLGGLALAAVGVAEARATEAGAALPVATTTTASGATPIASDVAPLPLEGWLRQTRGGNCGCSPCWGPPAPPPRAARRPPRGLA